MQNRAEWEARAMAIVQDLVEEFDGTNVIVDEADNDDLRSVSC